MTSPVITERSLRAPGPRFGAATLGVVLLAGVLRFWALDFGLPHPLVRPDEAPVVSHTLEVAHGEPNLHWVVYPSAYVYLSWLWGAAGAALVSGQGYAALGAERPDRLFLLGRALSATAGVLTVLLLVLVARPVLGDGAALAAGFLLATCFLHARDCHAMKPDALVTLAGVAALGAMQPVARRATLRTAALAGVAVGGALAMKYTAVVLLVPLWVATVMGTPRRGWRRLLPAPFPAAAASAGAVFVATSPYLLFDPESLDHLWRGLGMIFSRHAAAVGAWGPPLSPQTFAGRLAYHCTFSLRYGAGLLATLAAPVALGWGLLSRRPLLVLAAVYTLAHVVVVSVGNQSFARLVTPVTPMLALLEAGTLAALAARVVPRHAAAGLAVGAALLAAEPLARTVAHDRLVARTDTRELATAWMADHLRPGARVAVFGQRFWPWGTPRLPPGVEPSEEVRLDARRLAAAGVEVLVTHDHPLAFSTVDRRALAALAPRLRLLAEFDPFGARRAEAVFEPADAFYVPFHGFAGVVRPGPQVRIHAFE